VIRHLVQSGRQTELVDLDLLKLVEGEVWETQSQLETAAVVLAGEVDAWCGDRHLGRAGGRHDVFEGPGHVVYAPPDTALRLDAVGGAAELAIASAPAGASAAAAARVIGPSEQRVRQVGEGNWSRAVRTILGPEDVASRLLLGETVNPAGNWSSYPPHKHDVQAPPQEVRLEEVYLFKVDPPSGFGVQVRYDDEGLDEAALVRDGDVAVITSGYHPVVAAPGYALYYLWVMAGEGRQMVPHLDDRHAWIQRGT
jgi:5-deoxy-glucuronate isomerase